METRNKLVNQLPVGPDQCFPDSIGLFARADSDIASTFLSRYPNQRATPRLAEARSPAFLCDPARCGHKPVGRSHVPTVRACGKLHTVAFRWVVDKKLYYAFIDSAEDTRPTRPRDTKI